MFIPCFAVDVGKQHNFYSEKLLIGIKGEGVTLPHPFVVDGYISESLPL
jgi:hypothetical protein